MLLVLRFCQIVGPSTYGDYAVQSDACVGLLLADNLGSESVEAAVYVLVATVNLLDVLYDTLAIGIESRKQQCHTGTNVGRSHCGGAQAALMVVADDGCTMGVAEDNLCAHINQFVHEEEPTLEHLLVDEHRAFGLGGHHKEHTQQVGSEAGPRRIGDGHNGAIHKTLNLVVLLTGDENIVAALLKADTHTLKLRRNDAEVLKRHIFDCQLRLSHCSHTDETTHLNHIGQHRVLRTTELLHTLDAQQVGGNTLNLGTHTAEHLAELLNVGLASGVVDGCGSLGQHCGHNDVGGTRNRGLEGKWVDIDLGIAAQSILLKCVELGLNGICIGAFNKQELVNAFDLKYEPVMVLAIGKGAEKIQLLSITEDQDHRYFRDKGIHYVPKVQIEDLIM